MSNTTTPNFTFGPSKFRFSGPCPQNFDFSTLKKDFSVGFAFLDKFDFHYLIFLIGESSRLISDSDQASLRVHNCGLAVDPAAWHSGHHREQSRVRAEGTPEAGGAPPVQQRLGEL